MNTSLELVSMSAAAAMVAACSHTTEREIVREQPIVQQRRCRYLQGGGLLPITNGCSSMENLPR